MNLKKLVLLLALVVGAASLFAFDRGECREIIENGEVQNLEGTLDSRDGNTYLKVGRDEYEVLRGPGMFTYNDGDKIKLEGYVSEMKILPTKVIIGGVEVPVGPGRRFGCRRYDEDGKRGFPERDGTPKKGR